jgi:hypothetical protein
VERTEVEIVDVATAPHEEFGVFDAPHLGAEERAGHVRTVGSTAPFHHPRRGAHPAGNLRA